MNTLSSLTGATGGMLNYIVTTFTEEVYLWIMKP